MMRILKKSIILLLIQSFVFLQGVQGADMHSCDAFSTLSPSVSLTDNFLQKAFLSLPADRKLDEEIEERRDVNLREKYERILHWTQEGEFLDNVLRIANSEKTVKVETKMLNSIISRLYSHLPLGKIVSKGKMGDRFVVFEVSGISREGFGIKDLNDIFGYELNTRLIGLRSKILYRKMLEKGLIEGEEGHVYSTYKEDVYLVKRDLKVELTILKDLLNEIKQELTLEIDQVIKNQSLYREKFEKNGGTINEQETIVYAINMGISGEITQESDEARLNADINAHQAISFGGDISFTKKDYEATINKVDKLRGELINETSIFLQDDIDKGIYFLRQEISNALRKNKQWHELSDEIKGYFSNNVDSFNKTKSYFSFLRLQDYIKKWQVDYDKAKDRFGKTAAIIGELNKFMENNKEIDEVEFDENIRDLLKKVHEIISQETKDPSLSSAFAYHGQAPKMKRPVAITLDIKNMGLMNLKSFEVELQLISRALKSGNYDEVQLLWRSAADDVTIKLQKVMHLTKNILVNRLKLKSTNVVELMGGDEFTLIVDEENIDKDQLAQLLQDIKRYIQQEFDIGVRMGATLAVNDFRIDFSDKGDMRNQFAHAKALIELDEGVERLKADEAKGDHNTILIQDPEGVWITYRDTTQEDRAITKEDSLIFNQQNIEQAI